MALIGRGLLAVGSWALARFFACCCPEAEVHIVADVATVADGDIDAEAFVICGACARNAARKLLRNGRWVDMMVYVGEEDGRTEARAVVL